MAAADSVMTYKKLGKSGLKVSSLCLGTLTFGVTDRPGNCNEEQSHALLNRYIDLGGNLIDTSDVYSGGQSQEFIGNWLQKIGSKREEMVICTKARFGTGEMGSVNGACLSRKYLTYEVEKSLKKLQTDYIDLYTWHCWDSSTPLEESLRTMDDLIRSGKIRYFGVSNFCGWQLQKLVERSRALGLNHCVSISQQYSLLQREVELEIADVCQNESIALLPWSPLKGGWLSGKFTRSQNAPPEGTRVHYSTTTGYGKTGTQSHPDWDQFAGNEKVWRLLDVMRTIADNHNKSVSQVALKWLLQKDAVTSVVMGCKTISQLEDNMGAGDRTWELSSHDMEILDTASQYDVPYPYNIINKLNNRSKTWKF